MSNEQKESLTVSLSDVPRGSRETSSDYLTADGPDDKGNYTHSADTPSSDEGELGAV